MASIQRWSASSSAIIIVVVVAIATKTTRASAGMLTTLEQHSQGIQANSPARCLSPLALALCGPTRQRVESQTQPGLDDIHPSIHFGRLISPSPLPLLLPHHLFLSAHPSLSLSFSSFRPIIEPRLSNSSPNAVQCLPSSRRPSMEVGATSTHPSHSPRS